MIKVLNYKIPTSIGAMVLIAAMNLNIINISGSVLQNNIDEMQAVQRIQLNMIREETGFDLSKENVDNWNIYNNEEYGFRIKFPETKTQIEDEKKENYFEDYTGIDIQPYKISFELFTIRIWDNDENFELKNYLAADEFCAIEKKFCQSFRNSNEILLNRTNIAEKDWFQTVNKPQRFFMPFPENNYVLDFELTDLRHKREFRSVLATLEFAKNVVN